MCGASRYPYCPLSGPSSHRCPALNGPALRRAARAALQGELEHLIDLRHELEAQRPAQVLGDLFGVGLD